MINGEDKCLGPRGHARRMPHVPTSGRDVEPARTETLPTWERLRRRHPAPPVGTPGAPPGESSMRPAGGGRGALAAHSPQTNNLRLPRRLPGALGAVQGVVRPVVGGDRPPFGDPFPDHGALEEGPFKSQRAAHDGPAGPGRRPRSQQPVQRLRRRGCKGWASLHLASIGVAEDPMLPPHRPGRRCPRR